MEMPVQMGLFGEVVCGKGPEVAVDLGGDGVRLRTLEGLVGDLMARGRRWTLVGLQSACGAAGRPAGEASISARLRELSGKGFVHEKARVGGARRGLWEYWWTPGVVDAWRARGG